MENYLLPYDFMNSFYNWLYEEYNLIEEKVLEFYIIKKEDKEEINDIEDINDLNEEDEEDENNFIGELLNKEEKKKKKKRK